MVHPAAGPGKEQGGSCKSGCQNGGGFDQETSLTLSFKAALALAGTGHLCKGDKQENSAASYSLGVRGAAQLIPRATFCGFQFTFLFTSP